MQDGSRLPEKIASTPSYAELVKRLGGLPQAEMVMRSEGSSRELIRQALLRIDRQLQADPVGKWGPALLKCARAAAEAWEVPMAMVLGHGHGRTGVGCRATYISLAQQATGLASAKLAAVIGSSHKAVLAMLRVHDDRMQRSPGYADCYNQASSLMQGGPSRPFFASLLNEPVTLLDPDTAEAFRGAGQSLASRQGTSGPEVHALPYERINFRPSLEARKKMAEKPGLFIPQGEIEARIEAWVDGDHDTPARVPKKSRKKLGATVIRRENFDDLWRKVRRGAYCNAVAYDIGESLPSRHAREFISTQARRAIPVLGFRVMAVKGGSCLRLYAQETRSIYSTYNQEDISQILPQAE